MGVKDGPVERARRRIEADLARVVTDVAAARRSSGLSQRAVAAACGVDQATIARIESRQTRAPDLRLIAAFAGAVGLDVRIHPYPGGDAIRDAGQQRLLHRFRLHLHPRIALSTEVPLAIPRDLRAWDAMLRARMWSRPVEAETVVDDVQALERRLRRKIRDGAVEGVILVIAETRRNRRAIDAAPSAFQDFDRNARRVLRALREARDPGGSALLFL